MLLSLRISMLVVTYIFFFRESFFSELAISFMPYIIWFCIILLTIEIFLIIHLCRKKNKYKSKIILLTVLLTSLTFWVWTLYSLEYFWFYNQNDESSRLKNNEEWIKVFYSNIYYKNIDYKSLQEKIEQENPDIVVLVEFSDNHENEMKKFFKENYQYMNRNSRSTMLAGDVVFSKIPLKNITETHLVEAGARNYSYMRIFPDGYETWIDLYVIHTSAPVSLKNFKMRNTQISKLKSDFLLNNLNNKTIVIWDFNLSPWSYYYKQLTSDRNMLNGLRYQSPTYTWSLFKHKIFRSHIDQLFISPWIKISEVNIEDLEWSDHRSFSFYFWV